GLRAILCRNAVIERAGRPGIGPKQPVQRPHLSTESDLTLERIRQPDRWAFPLVGIPSVHVLIELAVLLLERHSRQQVFGSLFDRIRRILVDFHLRFSFHVAVYRFAFKARYSFGVMPVY